MPALLLLDEVDAPLHPSFTKVLLNVLKSELVDKIGLSVILTTHSPSTVALSPADSVFELVRSPRRIRPTNPSAACQILSSGFVAISAPDIVVIVESGDDVDYYEALYSALLRAGFSPNPPLKFVPASRSRTNKADGGCTQVRQWAAKRAQLEISRFRGLVDLDDGAPEDAVITRLKRYSWENYLFDPITLIAYCLSRSIPLPFATTAPAPKSIIEYPNFKPAIIQELVTGFCNWIAAETQKPELGFTNTVSCSYVGWKPIDVPEVWTTLRGHDLEKLIREPLNKLGKGHNRGALVKENNYDELIKFQTSSMPQLISCDFVVIFNRILSENL